MCGITGFWKRDRFSGDESLHVRNMAERLWHRGPDGYGFHIDPSNNLAMGHARLSIIDLHTGDQPLFDAKKKIVLTVNGEFYDYKRIRTNLRLEGFKFNTKSDSEIAIPLFKKYGLDFLEHLRGEFAIALFDEKEQRLILVRDRVG